MKPISYAFALLAAVLALVVPAKAEGTPAQVTVTPAECTAAVGEKVAFAIDYKATDGSALYSWFAPLERRNAPKGFFEKTSRKINKNAKNGNYDNIHLAPYRVVKGNPTEGQEKFTLDLSDFVPGSYMFAIRARFIKDGKLYARMIPVKLTVTPKVDTVCEIFTVTPENATASSGEKIEFTVAYKTRPGYTLYSWFAPLERRNAPKGFFEKTSRKINKNAKNGNYDNIHLAPYRVVKGNPTEGQEKFTLDLSDFVPGSYMFAIRARFIKDGKLYARMIPVKLTVAPPVAPKRRALAPGEKAKLSDYLIYVDDDAAPSVKRAASKLQEVLFKASGVRLPLFNQPLSPMIAVGASAAAKAAGIDAENIGFDGYVLRRKGSDIFIVGREMPRDGVTPQYGKSFGTTYGVFAFLEKHLGIYHLLPGEKGWYYPEITGEYIFGDIDESYTPRFTYRFLWKISGSNPAVDEWIGYNGNLNGTFGSRYFSSSHSWVYLYPTPNQWEAGAVPTREATFRKKPEIFELNSEGRRVMPGAGVMFSLCLGNPATTEDIIERIPKIVELRGKKYPELQGLKFYTLSPNDNAPYCSCKLCRAKMRPVTKEMAGDAAYDLHFNWTELCFDSFRRVCEALPDYQFSSYLYHSTQFPYPGIRPMPANFIANFAPLHCGYGPVRHSDKVNATWHKWIRSWDGIFAGQSYYGLDFWIRQYYGAPQPPCLRLMNETFKVLRERPFTGVLFYGNTGYGQSGMSAWVLSKLMYDPDQDAEALGKLYLQKAYGEKATVFMQQLWDTVEKQTRAFYNLYDGKGGWDMNTEMLADLYSPIYPELERLYLAALAVAGNENQRWRLEMFGANLKLLRYYLVRLGLMSDGDSPLRLTAAEYDRLNRARMPGHPLHHLLSPSVMPNQLTLSSRIHAEITTELAGKSEFRPFARQTAGEFIIVPDRDGVVELEFSGHTRRYNPVKKRNYLKHVEFFNLYDEKRRLLMTGMTDSNGVARFEGKKGKVYRFIYMPAGDFHAQPYWYLKRCSAPYAHGQWNDGNGFRFYDVKSPLYFFVEPGTKTVDIYLNHTYVRAFHVNLLDPSGKLAASVRRDKADSDELHVPAVPGWWKLEFPGERGFCGRLRLGYGLTGYVVPDPARAVKITSKTAPK